MANFGYDDSVPAANDDPSDDQPVMLTNAENIALIIAEDHVGFNAEEGGKHNKVTWVAQLTDPGSASGETRAYSKTTSGITMPYYQRDNVATVFPLSPIKAFARINSTGTIISSWNITSVVKSGTASAPIYTFTITNAMRTTNYGVIFLGAQGNLGHGIANSYSITSTTQFALNFNHVGSGSTTANLPTDITVAVLEF